VVVQAYILIQTEVGKAASVAEAIAGIAGVVLAEDVTGPVRRTAASSPGPTDNPAEEAKKGKISRRSSDSETSAKVRVAVTMT
jgi:hypothetical protein